MPGHELFDAVVIGGGPAGLSAARTAAKSGLKTLLLEKLSAAGELGHPCSAVIAPLPGFVTGQRQEDGLHFPELDLFIPAALVIGSLYKQCYISPGGLTFEAIFPNRDDFPIAAVDKAVLLRLMAEEAVAAGAELRFGTPVTGLVIENGWIVGVCTRQEKIHARIVLSAEGVSRQFTLEGGLYPPSSKRYAFIAAEEVEAPAIQPHHAGQQINTLGRRYTSVNKPAFGAVVIPTAGRAGIYFSVFADRPQACTEESLWCYLEEYKHNDPRVKDLFTESKVTNRAGTRMVICDAPPHVVKDGLIGVGDSVTPGGHLGILPCIYLGQQAARIAAQAIARGDTSAKSLAAYDRLFHGPLLRGLDMEGKIITSMAEMSDEELDRISGTLGRVNLAPFFSGSWKPMMMEMLKWGMSSLPLILRDWQLIRRMMGNKPAVHTSA